MSTEEVLRGPSMKESPANEITEPLSDASGSERSGNEADKISDENPEDSNNQVVDETPTDQLPDDDVEGTTKQIDEMTETQTHSQSPVEGETELPLTVSEEVPVNNVVEDESPELNQEEAKDSSEGPIAVADTTSSSEDDGNQDFLIQQAASSMSMDPKEMAPGQRSKSKRNSQKFQNVVSELGHFSTARNLHGRDSEKEELAKCWSRTLRYQCQEIVVISGKPGNGKSTLVNSMRPIVAMEKPKSFFISGKFEERSHNNRGPFDVFVTAFSRYVNKLLDTDDDLLLDTVKDAVKARVKGDRKILIRAIPAMEQLLVRQQRTSIGTVSSTGSGAEASLKTQLYGSESANRLRIAFSAAVAAICSVTPVLLFLDDLQWADTGSLDLLRGLMQSHDSMSLLVVACRRSNNVEEVCRSGQAALQTENLLSDANTSLAIKEKKKAIQSILREFQNDDSVRLTYIDLNELSYESLSVLVSDILKKKPEEVAGLSRIVFSKTQGNIFHLFQILRLLVDLGMIRREHHSWVWNENEIERELESSRSISELVRRTIQSLPRPVQEALKAAACLGTEIDTSAVDIVLSTSTASLLKQAASEGLLIFSAQYGGYRFAHDWIRHAAYSLIPAEERSEFHLKLGQRLWRGSSQIALDQNIMLIVSLMNFGSHLVTDDRERYKLASLNLKAGQKALKLPSFSDAAAYLKKGIELLNDDCWEADYNLALNLHSNIAECCCITGDYESVATSIGEVVQHAHSLDDKIRAYSALLASMEQQDDLEEATTVCADVVGKLGERLPSNPTKLTVAREFIKIRLAFRGRSDEDILAIPKMTDTRKRQCADFLSQGFIAAWRSKSPMSGMFALRSAVISLRYGIHTASSLSFAAYASTLCGLHIDVHEGYRIGQLAVKLAERNNSPRFVSYVFLFFAGMIAHWTRPMTEVIDSLEHGRNVGMDSGHVSPGCQNWLMVCLGKLVTGKKLTDVKAYCKGLLRQARSYRQRGTEISVSLILQLIHCYEGAAPNPSRLTGTALDYDETLRESQETKDQVGVIQHFYFTMELCYMFGDYKEAAKMMELTMALNTGSAPTFLAASLQFMQALVAVTLCRRGMNRGQNKKLARKFLSDFVKWCKDAPDNYLHHRYLLEAETKSLDRSNDDSVMTSYTLAFVNAEKQRNLMIMALSQERLGYYLGAQGKKREALSHWTKAAGLYDAWGALAKSKVLRDKIDNDDFEREQQVIAENTRKSCF